MKYIKGFNENISLEDNSFSEEKDNIMNTIDSFMKEYEEFTKRVSPKYWRSTGHHFTELRKMKSDLVRFTEISEEEKEKVKEYISEKRTTQMPTEEHKLFGINSMREFKGDLVPSLKMLVSTDNGIVLTDRVKELDIENSKISFINDLNKMVNISFNDFFILDDEDRILKYKTKLLIDLYNSLK